MSRCNKIVRAYFARHFSSLSLSLSLVTASVLVLLFAFSLFSPHFVFASTTNGTVDSTSRYAWSENMGWIDFGSSYGAVTITDSALSGYAWSETTGWISLNCSNTSSCGTVDYKVSNNGEGTLSGYAWMENAGWLDFDPTGGGVTIDSSGDFSGYAWGENTGWIVFNCSTTSSCNTVSYKVNTDWRPASSRPTRSSGSTSLAYRNNFLAQQALLNQPIPLPVTIIEEHTVPRETPIVVKDNSKKSPGRANNSSSNTPATKNEPSKTPSQEPPAPLTSRVEVVIVDTDKKPVEGATVTLYSTPRVTTTNQDGKAIFENVEPGPHRLVVNYRGQEGEQAINLDESMAEFQFKIQIEAKSPLLAKSTLMVLGGLVLIIVLILLVKFKKI